MKKILIVDDEHISLMMTNHILSTEYQTFCASSGKEAIKIYHQEQPDMVLSDLRMPNMNGYELQQHLQEYYSRKIPFMFMTADKDTDTEVKGFENGALDFITKPFRADVLLRRVDNILQTVAQIQGLRHVATTDPMTGVLNKSSSQETINAVCQQNTQGVLMMIDLDNFKPVNDIYGHAMGDKLLIRFAEIIQSAVRSTDITGRLGGDEFIAFCRNITDESVIAKKSDYINKQILLSAKQFMGEDMTIPIGASIGCVFAPDEGNDFLTLYQKADKALYAVKQNGKHGCRFYGEMLHAEERDTSKVSDLANAFTILKERHQAKGAFVLTQEQFRTIFQFLFRFSANYQKEVWFLLLSCKEIKKCNRSFDDVSETLLDVIRCSLRQSDVITQSSQNQFMILLLETSESNLKYVTDRIKQNWDSAGLGDCYELSYEITTLE